MPHRSRRSCLSFPTIKGLAPRRRRSGLGPQPIRTGSDCGGQGKIGRPEIRTPRRNVRFGFERTPQGTRLAKQLVFDWRVSEGWKDGHGLVRRFLRSIRLDSVLRQMPFMLIGSHVPRDDALSHRFGAGEFVAVYIGLVLLRIGFRER